MKQRYFSASALVLLTGFLSPAIAQSDDVYYDPQRDRPSEPYVRPTHNEASTPQNAPVASNSQATPYDDLQYYDDEYADDYAYSSRIRRYHRPASYSYYDNYYMDPFRYDPYFYDRLYFRPQLVVSFGRSSFWNHYSYRPVYNSWYDYSFNSWNPYFSSPWGCNSYYGWNNYYGYNQWNTYNDYSYNNHYHNRNSNSNNNSYNSNQRHWNPNGTYTGARTVGSSISPSSPRIGRETISPRNNGGTIDNRPTHSGRISANPRNPQNTSPADVQRGDVNTTRINPSSPTRTYERPTRTESLDRPTQTNEQRPTRTYERPEQTNETRPTRTYERPSQTTEQPTRTYERPSRSETRSEPTRTERPSRSETRSESTRTEHRSAPSRSESPSRSSNSSSGGSNKSSSSPRGPR
ncbi:MAG: hypothetical protein RIS64_1057 [Bacteroidota bacterium]|jgi:hypothetical protein